jgi:predicted nucleotidyltransferase
METIFKPGAMKILRLFYEDKSQSLHLREIARKTSMNENNATRFLSLLEAAKILKSKKEGNLKKYSIIKNNSLFGLFSLLDIEKFEALPSMRKTAIASFLHTLLKQPIIVILFGSTAKNQMRENSDIDLLLITNEKISTIEAEKEAEAQTGIRVQPFIIQYENFLKELKLKQDSVIQSALNIGFPITNHLKFYQLVCYEN